MHKNVKYTFKFINMFVFFFLQCVRTINVNRVTGFIKLSIWPKDFERNNGAIQLITTFIYKHYFCILGLEIL